MVNILKVFRNGQKSGYKKGYRKGFKKAKIIGARKLRHQNTYHTDRSLYYHRQEQLRNREQGDRY